MKPKSILRLTIFVIGILFLSSSRLHAQQYKLRQVTTMVGMKSESTIYVKGMRKRTEGGGMMGMGANVVTIEQCDLQRTIKINEKKKIYYIEPFTNEEEINEKHKPASPKNKAVTTARNVSAEKSSPQKGGVIYMYYNITDTGERKKMHGLTARHVWTTQKIRPSADACMMKDSMIIKTDGWYIDLPQFNCRVHYFGSSPVQRNGNQPVECKDRYESQRTGKGKLGFPLIEKKTMIMGNGVGAATEMESNLETLEFSMQKLDSMLFEIPIGYTQTVNQEDLQDAFDVNHPEGGTNNNTRERPVPDQQKKPGLIRIGVYAPGGDQQIDGSQMQIHMISQLTAGNMEGVAISSEAEARKYGCDMVLTTEFTRIKAGSKIGGLLKVIKSTDPAAATSFNIAVNFHLKHQADGATQLERNIEGKFDGKIDAAAKKALDKGCSAVIEEME
jgi:hypothetical protein